MSDFEFGIWGEIYGVEGWVCVPGSGAIGGINLPEGQIEGSPMHRVGDTKHNPHYPCCLNGNDYQEP